MLIDTIYSSEKFCYSFNIKYPVNTLKVEINHGDGSASNVFFVSQIIKLTPNRRSYKRVMDVLAHEESTLNQQLVKPHKNNTGIFCYSSKENYT